MALSVAGSTSRACISSDIAAAWRLACCVSAAWPSATFCAAAMLESTPS